MAPLVTKYKIHKHDNINILIKVEYIMKDINKPGDTREIKKIKIEEVEDCPDLEKFI
jgi:hypothetical protein